VYHSGLLDYREHYSGNISAIMFALDNPERQKTVDDDEIPVLVPNTKVRDQSEEGAQVRIGPNIRCEGYSAICGLKIN
jgi:hypothetical protein